MSKIDNKPNKPLVSIITVVLNNKKFIEKSILSVLNQNYKNIELLIIDGGSTDGTLNVIKKYRNKINFMVSEKDNGLYDAMNKGIKNSKGSIIGILNSDDIYYPNAISTAVKYFTSNQNIDFLFGGVIKHKLLHGYKPWKICWSFGFYSSHSIGFFITRKAQMKVGYYNTRYRFSSDYDLFYRMIVKKNMIGMATKKSEVFGKFRRGGISSQITFFEYLVETMKIRIDNGQNIFIVFIIFLAKVFKKIISK